MKYRLTQIIGHSVISCALMASSQLMAQPEVDQRVRQLEKKLQEIQDELIRIKTESAQTTRKMDQIQETSTQTTKKVEQIQQTTQKVEQQQKPTMDAGLT